MGWLKTRLPKKRWKRLCLYLLSGCVILLAADMVLVQCWRHVEIGYDTTRITSPLNAEGLPDYLAARNAACSKGVTTENNAAPALLAITADGHADYMEWLKAHSSAGDDLDREWDEAIRQPWKSAEHPDRVRWLETQRELLGQMDAALRKDRFYVPQTAMDTGEMTASLLPWISHVRSCANLLAMDAMRAAGDGDAVTFQRDVLDIGKLSRLACQGSTLIEYLVAQAVEDEGSMTLQRGATVAFPRTAEASKLLRMWQTMPAFPDESRVMDMGERFQSLDMWCRGSKGTLRAAMGGTGTSNTMQGLLVPIHYNSALRTFNHYFDELVAAQQMPTYTQRAAAMKAVTDESIRTRSWLSISDLLVSVLLPSLEHTVLLHERTVVDHDLATVALALRVYREAHGKFPADLGAISPEVMPAVPSDGFVEKPLHYRREGNGYVLYSVGPDGQDDGGRDRHETSDPKHWDMVVKSQG